MILVMKVAGTMVSGWSVFGLATRPADEPAAAAPPATARAIAGPAAGTAVDRARAAAGASPRPLAPRTGPLAAANDADAPAPGRRSARITGGGPSEGAVATPQFQSRARGVGSRFRGAVPRPLAHRSEKWQ
jgi:type IV secretion system protein VirB6